MYGIIDLLIVYASSVNVCKNRIDMYLARDRLHLESYLQTLDKPTVSLSAVISGVAWMAILLNVLSLLLLNRKYELCSPENAHVH